MCQRQGYKAKYACFDCRKCFRYERVAVGEAKICPQCTGILHSMGLDFRAPKQSEVDQWRKVQRLFEQGIDFNCCGCTGPGYRPRLLSEVEGFLEQEAEKKMGEGQRLLKKFSSRKRLLKTYQPPFEKKGASPCAP